MVKILRIFSYKSVKETLLFWIYFCWIGHWLITRSFKCTLDWIWPAWISINNCLEMLTPLERGHQIIGSFLFRKAETLLRGEWHDNIFNYLYPGVDFNDSEGCETWNCQISICAQVDRHDFCICLNRKEVIPVFSTCVSARVPPEETHGCLQQNIAGLVKHPGARSRGPFCWLQ